jgi:hypothetical protein
MSGVSTRWASEEREERDVAEPLEWGGHGGQWQCHDGRWQLGM